MHHLFVRSALSLFVVVALLTPAFLHAAGDLEVAGWLPYWRAEQSVKDARAHIEEVDTLYPFAYTVKLDGTLKDLASLSKSHWKRLFKEAKEERVEVIPTVMWSDRVQIETILNTAPLRTAHIEAIVSMVSKGKYDGVDIDYEGKSAETKDGFSLFLKELKKELGSKILVCTIEARTPPDSLYTEIPNPIRYSNDYKEIAKHCDRVQIMAYDQQRADLKLNAARIGEPYMPVSDPDWVEKVITLALKDIPKEKIMLGIPSYGHHYAVTVAPNWYRDYRRIGALNIPDMLDVARENKVKPSRNKAGEMSFSYMPKSSPVKIPSSIKAPKGTSSGNEVAARALAYANKTGTEVTFHIGWYSDAEAMYDKVALAEKYDLRGVAFFKIDGEEDRKIWKLLED